MVVLNEINDGLVTVWRWIFMDENVSAIFTRTSILFVLFFFLFLVHCHFGSMKTYKKTVQSEKITDRKKIYIVVTMPACKTVQAHEHKNTADESNE